jgi:hypothetical protein
MSTRVASTGWNFSENQRMGNADYNESVNINNNSPMLAFIHFNESKMETAEEEEMVLTTGVPDAVAGERVVP